MNMSAGGLAAFLIGIAGAAAAQPAVTGTILSGASGTARLALGARIASPPRSWTEIVFSDGSSILLGPGAELVVHRLAADRIGATGSGRIRVVAMDGMAVELATPGATITVSAADAVLQAVPHGSVAMLGGREIVVTQDTGRRTLRRPGFSVALDGSGTRRDDARQIVAALAPFGSSEPPATTASPAPPAPSAPASAQRAKRGPALAAATTDLTTGITAQSGSFTASALPRFSAPAPVPIAPVPIASVAPSTTEAVAVVTSTPAISVPSVATPVAVVVPTSNNSAAAQPTNAIPTLNLSSYLPPPLTSNPGPTSPTTPTTPTTPSLPPQPTFVPVDGSLLAGLRGTAGPITLPGTTTSVTAGLVPSNEHLAWGFFMPAGSKTTPAAALASPGLTFSLDRNALPVGSLQTVTGTATYTGGLIANAFGVNGYKTGQFAQTWNFGTRAGTLNAAIDGSTWRGMSLTLLFDASRYFGFGVSTSDQRTLSITGLFYNATPLSPGSVPSATGGTFSVGGPLIGGSTIGAPITGGIFVGTKR